MSMQRSTSRIRTTHTGSLPRPPDMLETLHRLAAGQPVDTAAYESALTRHVADIVKRQVEAGIDTVSDGECSKPSFQHYVAERLDGFEARIPAGRLAGADGADGARLHGRADVPRFLRRRARKQPVQEHDPHGAAGLRRADPL